MSCLPLGLEGFLLRCEAGHAQNGGDALDPFQEPRVLAVDLERPVGEVVVVEEQGRHRGQLQAYCLIVVTGSICFRAGDLSFQPQLAGVRESLRELDALSIAHLGGPEAQRSEGIGHGGVVPTRHPGLSRIPRRPYPAGSLDGRVALQNRSNQCIPAEPALAWKRIPFHLMAVLRSLLRRLAQSPPASKAHENVRHAQTSKSFHPHLSLVRSTNAAPHRTTRAQRRTRTVFR